MLAIKAENKDLAKNFDKYFDVHIRSWAWSHREDDYKNKT